MYDDGIALLHAKSDVQEYVVESVSGKHFRLCTLAKAMRSLCQSLSFGRGHQLQPCN